MAGALRLIAVSVLFAFPGGQRVAQPDDRAGEGIDPAVFQPFQRLTTGAEQLDWEGEARFLQRAINSVWERNGWTSEADRFARDVACEIAAVPPWEPMQRLNLLTERIEERYTLSPANRTRFRKAVMREAARLLLRNSGVLLKQTREWVEARVQGQPFTPRQVAQWTKESEPLLAQLRESTDRLARDLRPMLGPRERRILTRDLHSLNKRQRFIDDMTARWARGQWQPTDWGLDDGPAVTTNDLRNKVPSQADTMTRREAPAVPLIDHWRAYDPSTWAAYVLVFQNRFNLDAGQATAAESILDELVARANRYLDSNREALDKIPPTKRSTDDAYEPVRTLFDELQRRVEAIPTSSQRERSGA